MDCVLSDNEIYQLIADDAPFGDLTTSLLIEDKDVTLELSARYDMTLSGVEEAVRMFALKGVPVEQLHQSGDTIAAGTLILKATGLASKLFLLWKPAQVLMEWMSGVASLAKVMVDSANGVPVACTRKQVPCTKALSVKAIRSGGAIMHRLGASDTILVFAEHRQFVDLAPNEFVELIDKKAPEHKGVFEAHSLEDALVWARAGVDVLQLDKFSPADVRECKVILVKEGLKTKLGIAGGVNADNVAEYAASGVDVIVTSAPYYAKPKDVQVRFKSVSDC